MEQKNRSIIVVAITLIIVIAIFTSFGRNLFAQNTPEVVLPNTGDTSLQSPGSDHQPEENPYHLVDVTPETVQNVIATLSRPGSYYRDITLETRWEDGSSLVQVQIWHDENLSHIRQVLPSGAIRHDLIDESTQYYWYEGSQQYKTLNSDDRSADLAQHIPTYETVLSLDQSVITNAGYEQKDTFSCILVEVSPTDPDRTERYWVSLDSGLLVAAEMERDGTVVYQMSANGPVTTPCPPDASFRLPDGTDLLSNEP